MQLVAESHCGHPGMIRKALILLLSLAAATTLALHLVSLAGGFTWDNLPWDPTDTRVLANFRSDGSVIFEYTKPVSRTTPLSSWDVDCEIFYARIWVFDDGLMRYWSLESQVWLLVPFVLFSAYPLIAFVRGPLRRWRQGKPGHCVKCGYDLRGNVSRVCPECGERIISVATSDDSVASAD